MQARDVMTRDVVTVHPGTSVRDAAQAMARGGFAALPVVDDGRLVGIVAEADVLRDRVPEDPRLHLRRDDAAPTPPPSPLVGGVMTTAVRSVGAAADVADIARLLVHERLRSVPVVDGDRLVGIVSRRDLLRTLVRPDAEIAEELRRLVERYTGELDAWSVTVADGAATVRRTRGAAQPSAGVEQQALAALARTVGGVVGVRVTTGTPDGGDPAPAD
ncbi:HPP family protein [Geodermatophilus sp. DSM 44513]|uniref:CBS domain-containing protein n=1 Tax=Geodermatophilus sp. DSM 44513 TaxID=1528104 RepID=UPI00126CA1F2|nr:CBS domain-containing protein [Geodermatophilus sp. DSM 44513]WNV74260.1 CBS domain-containing protein [Geodermatophilus sp. DSM 44513]